MLGRQFCITITGKNFVKWRTDVPSFFKGKLIVITGGGSGLGLELASRICSYGGKVIIIGRNLKRLQRAQKEILKKTPDAYLEFYSKDVSQYKEMENLFNEINAKHSTINGIFINASQVYINDFRFIPFEKIEQILNTNVNGAIYTARAAIPYLSEKNSFLAFTSSIAGYAVAPESSIYTASKAAIISFSRILSQELAPRGVHVLTFSPGFFETTFAQGATATPFLMPIDRVVKRYLRAVVSKQEEVIFPFGLVCILHFWKCLTFIGLGTPLVVFATRRMYKFYGEGKPHINPDKETLIQDSFGFRRLICGISLNKRMADWLHDKCGIKKEKYRGKIIIKHI